jgi:hypothetical protein
MDIGGGWVCCGFDAGDHQHHDLGQVCSVVCNGSVA